MADLNKITQRYEVTADTSGLDKIAAAADKAAASTTKLSTATGGLATSSTSAEKSVLGVGKALDGYVRTMDPATRALGAAERGERLVASARAQGLPVTEAAMRAVANARARYEELTKATHEHTAATGLNRTQVFELGHIVRSLSDDFASGTLGIRSFAQEGGRLGQVLSEGNGGVSGTLKSIGGLVAKAATGWIGFGVAVAAGVGVASVALLRFQSQQDRLALSLNGAGRYTGVTTSGLAGIANAAGARNPGLGQGGATSLAATFAGTGRISSGLLPGLLDVTTPFARGTGQDVSKAGEELAKAFSDPGKGADQLNEKLGFLDDKTKQLITNLERQGDLFGAQEVLLGKVGDAAARMSDRTWTLTKAYEALKNVVSGAGNAFSEDVERAFNPSLGDKISAALSERRELEGSLGNAWTSGRRAVVQGQIGSVDSRISDLRLGQAYQEYGESRLVGGAASDKTTNDLSIKIGEAVRKALPEIDRTQELTDTLKLLDDAIRNPETVAKTQGGLGALTTARSRYGSIAASSDPLLRINQDSQLAIQAAQAQTGAERTLVDARRAELEVLRSTGDATQAAAKSLAAWNDAIAKSNAEAEDALRSATQRAGLVGLSPIQRSLRENDYRYDEMRRNAVTAPGQVSALDGAYTALDDRTTPLARAMALGSSGSNSLLDAADALNGASAFGKLTNRVVPTMHARTLGAYRDSLSSTIDPAPVASDVTVSGGRRIASYAPAAATFAPGNIVAPGGGIASTFNRDYGAARATDAGAIMDEATVGRLHQASMELQAQQKLLDVRTASIGKSTEATQKAVATQEIWNSLQLDDATIKELGPARMAKITSSVNDNVDAQTRLNKQQQQYDSMVGASSSFQQLGSSFVGGAADDIFSTLHSNPRDLIGQLNTGDQMKYYSGQMSGNQVKDKVRQRQIQQLFDSILEKQGVSMIESGLFGKGTLGSPGYSPGLLGGVFNGLFGGLLGGGSSSGGASSGSGGGGLLGGLFGGIGKLFGFADGGIMTPQGPLALRRFATGGVNSGPTLSLSGERGPEAYVPLPDGRSIPVAMRGGGAPAIHVTQGGHTIVVQGDADGKAITQMRAELASAMRQQNDSLQRNIGPMLAKYNQRNG